MDENETYKEGSISKVSNISTNSDSINLECGDLPSTKVCVQHWLNSQVADTEQEEIMPEISIEYMNETLAKEINDNVSSDDFWPLPPLEGRGDADASGFSDATELDPGDPEILVTRKKPAPSADSSAKANSECDRRCSCGLKEFQELKNQIKTSEWEIQNQNKIIIKLMERQNKIDIRNKSYMEAMQKQNEQNMIIVQNQNKLEVTGIQETILRVTNDTIQQVVTGVAESVGIVVETGMTKMNKNLLSLQNEVTKNNNEIKNDLLTVSSHVQQLQNEVTNIKGDVLLAQAEYKQEIKSDINKIQKEVTEIRGDVLTSQNKVQTGLTQIESDIIQVENKMQNNFKIGLAQVENKIQKDLVQAEVNNKKQIDKLLLQGEGMATNVIAAVGSVDGRVKELGQCMGVISEEIDFLRKRIEGIEGATTRELQTQGNELVLMRDRVDFLERQIEEAKAIIQAHTSDNSILVSGLGNQVETLKRSITGIRDLYNECQQGINNLEGVVEASATQGNDLNNHLYEIDSKIKRVDELTEVIHTLVDAIKSLKNETYTSNYPKYHVPQECPAQPMNTNRPVTPTLPVTDNIPSIPSSPLLANSFTTPPSLAHPPIHDPIGAIPRNRNLRSDHVIADIVKREQKPCFNGDNVSPPIFLQEVERFFDLIQITEDRDRLQLFPTFLVTNPFEWWKLISYQVTTWDMAKDLFLRQYFNDYERQRYKAEWHSLECKNFSNVEEFTLRGLKILNTIKTKDSEQKKCERITVKLPEPLRDYLLNKQFQSTQHFLSCIKEAMLLKNFNPDLYFKKQKSSSSAPIGNFQNSSQNNGGNNNANQQNNANPSNNSNNHNNRNNHNSRYNNNNHNNSASPPNMNPRFKGNPKNYIPNFKYPNSGNNNGNGGSSSNSNFRNGYRSPPKSPPRGQNRNNSSSHRSSGQGNQNNGSSSYYRNSGYNRNPNGRSAGIPGTSTPGPGVNQVGRAATPNSPSRVTTPTTDPQISMSPQGTHLHITFPPNLFKNNGADLSSPQASTSNHFNKSEEYGEEMDEQTEN